MNTPRSEHIEGINRTIRMLIWLGHKQAVANMGAVGLTLPQASVLFSLEAHAGRATMSDLARMSQLAPATMTGIVDRIIAAGWVERERNLEDRRVVWVRLTEAGRDKIREIHEQRGEGINQLTADFTDAELEQFAALLRRLLGVMATQLEGTKIVLPDLMGLL